MITLSSFPAERISASALFIIAAAVVQCSKQQTSNSQSAKTLLLHFLSTVHCIYACMVRTCVTFLLSVKGKHSRGVAAPYGIYLSGISHQLSPLLVNHFCKCFYFFVFRRELAGARSETERNLATRRC
jgi:hypothetical protein